MNRLFDPDWGVEKHLEKTSSRVLVGAFRLLLFDLVSSTDVPGGGLSDCGLLIV